MYKELNHSQKRHGALQQENDDDAKTDLLRDLGDPDTEKHKHSLSLCDVFRALNQLNLQSFLGIITPERQRSITTIPAWKIALRWALGGQGRRRHLWAIIASSFAPLLLRFPLSLWALSQFCLGSNSSYRLLSPPVDTSGTAPPLCLNDIFTNWKLTWTRRANWEQLSKNYKLNGFRFRLWFSNKSALDWTEGELHIVPTSCSIWIAKDHSQDRIFVPF